MSESLVHLEHVNLVRGSRAVLHDISFSMRKGEQIALLGPNGCGKSTLMKMVTCEFYPLAEPEMHVRIFGREHWDVTELKKRLGVVQSELPGRPILSLSGFEVILTGFFSSSSLWPHLTITPDQLERTEATLHRVGATELRKRIFGEMSSGQQRRILIGRALVASADCLLLDEPSNALDLYAQHGLRELLRALARQGTSILLITHHVADIIPEIRRIVMMKDGRIVEDGSRVQLLTAEKLSELFAVQVRLEEHDGLLHAW